MATVTGITVERAQEIEDASVVSGGINVGNGHLILHTAGGTDIDAGVARPDAAIAAAVLVETNNRVTDVNAEETSRIAAINAEIAARDAAITAALDALIDDTGSISSLTGFTLASGWSTASVRYRVLKIGGLEIVDLYLAITRSGAAIANNAPGNITNVNIFTASPVEVHPSVSSIGIKGPGSGSGRLVGGIVTTGGVIALTSLGGTSDVGTNEVITFHSVFFK